MADNKKRGAKNDKPYRRPRKKVCVFCADKVDSIDYKDAEKLRKYISDKGKILPRRVTGACAKHQRKITDAVKSYINIHFSSYTIMRCFYGI